LGSHLGRHLGLSSDVVIWVVIWGCHLGVSSGVVIWRCHLVLSSGVVIWIVIGGLLSGFVIWGCHLLLSSGLSSEMTHSPFYLFIENLFTHLILNSTGSSQQNLHFLIRHFVKQLHSTSFTSFFTFDLPNIS
jgi:hypothetical protein